jgi:hypothetical protein
VRAIHDRGGIAIVAHPMLLDGEGTFLGYTRASQKDQLGLLSLFNSPEPPDGLETYNAKSDILWLSSANSEAKEFWKNHASSSLAFVGSDARLILKHVGSAGLFVPEEMFTSWQSVRSHLMTSSCMSSECALSLFEILSSFV